jgi:hypothetical protein
MKLKVIYNEYVKTFDININKKLGIIQQELLEKCMLIIYNIEYSEIKINNSNELYIIGSDEISFNITLYDFLNNIQKKENDIESIIIYDRKRDLNGNVIKNNTIIDKYVMWQNDYENNIFNLNNSNRMIHTEQEPVYRASNRHIIRYPLNSLLSNMLNISYNINNNSNNNLFNNSSNNLNNIRQETYTDNRNINNETNNEPNNEENDETNDILNNQSSNNEYIEFINNNREIDYINTVYNNLFSNIINYPDVNGLNLDRNELNYPDVNSSNLDNDELDNPELDNIENDNFTVYESNVNNTPEINNSNVNNTPEINSSPYRRYFNNNIFNDNRETNIYSNNDLIDGHIVIDNFINIFETISRNMNNIPYNNVNDISTNIVYDDVKIVLTEDEFNNLESFEYNISNLCKTVNENDNDIENNTYNENDIIQKECLICTECFEEGEILKKLNCNHVFHIDCIKSWLCEESKKCPICRVDAGIGIIK